MKLSLMNYNDCREKLLIKNGARATNGQKVPKCRIRSVTRQAQDTVSHKTNSAYGFTTIDKKKRGTSCPPPQEFTDTDKATKQTKLLVKNFCAHQNKLAQTALVNAYFIAAIHPWQTHILLFHHITGVPGYSRRGFIHNGNCKN